jgi:signal transduction histidine kinase
LGILGIFQDITQQRLAEARLVQGEKMEAVGRLTAGVAHDFNNLLTVIRGNLELLMRSVNEIATARPLVESVLAAADRGVGLVRQLAAVARKQPLQPTIMSVSPVLTGLTNLLERTLGPTIKINTAINEDTWTVRIDTAQLQSAVLNLAINARDAMRDGGELTLSAENRSVSAQDRILNPEVAPGDYVMISVTDTGTGIPDAVRNKVFEPFFTTKEPGKGTGLGLSMVHGFVRQSGGYVALESEVGLGTTVRLYFPKASLDGAASLPSVHTAA